MQTAAHHFRNGRLREAEATCRLLLKSHPESVDGLHLLALVLRRSGAHDEAERILRRCLALCPEHVEINANYGNLLADSGRPREAVSAYGKALAGDPKFRPARLGLVRLLNRIGEHRAAERHSAVLLGYDANDAEAWSARAGACRGLGELEDAESAYRRAVQINPRYGIAHHNLGALLAEAGRSEEALCAVDAAAGSGVRGPGIDFTRASILMSLYRFDEAERLLSQSVADAPRTLVTQRLLARLRFMRGRDEFDRDFVAAVRRFPDDVTLRLGYAQLLRGAGRLGEARAELAEGLERAPEDPRLLTETAALMQEAGDYGEALASARAAMAAAPGDTAAHSVLADALVALGRAAEAMPVIETLRRRNPLDQWYIALEATAARLLGHPRYRELCDFERFVRTFELPPPAGWSSLAEFHRDLAAVLLDRQRFREQPLDQSVRLGTQTPRSLLGDPHPVIRAFLGALDAPLEEYRRAIPFAPEHPLGARNAGATKLSGCWSVLLRQGGYHVNHVHPEGWISSAYYVEVPAEVADENLKSGWLKFGEPRFAVPGAAPEKMVQPAAGRLVLFPSYMWHGTTPLRSGERRLTIAFDAVPRSAG